MRKKKALKEEMKIAGEHNKRTRILVYTVGAFCAGIILIPFLRKDPVDFWFHVIAAVCFTGLYLIAKHSK